MNSEPPEDYPRDRISAADYWGATEESDNKDFIKAQAEGGESEAETWETLLVRGAEKLK